MNKMTLKQELSLVRELIKHHPEIILDDPDVVQCLAEHAEGNLGENVIDFRDAALKVLERKRVDLEKFSSELTQHSLKNYTSVQRIHRASISIMRAHDVQAFSTAIKDSVKEALQADKILLLVEKKFKSLEPNTYFGPIILCHDGFVLDYWGTSDPITLDRPRLRTCPEISLKIYNTMQEARIQSEALIPLNLAKTKKSGITSSKDYALLLLGSCDPETYQHGMGTDLLSFLGEVVKFALHKWID